MARIYRLKDDIKAEEFIRNMVWIDVYRVEYYYYYYISAVCTRTDESGEQDGLCFGSRACLVNLHSSLHPSSVHPSVCLLVHLFINPSFIYLRKLRAFDFILPAHQLRHWQSFTRTL